MVESSVSTPIVDGSTDSATPVLTAVSPPVPTPPAFTATVPPTMDSGVAAKAISEPETLPTITEQKVFQMADGRFYNPATGVSGNTREEAMGIAPITTPGPAGTPAPSGGMPVTAEDDVTASIKALFPQSDSLVKQYQDLRTSSGLTGLETQLADVNREIGDMNAVIQNIESDVRIQAAGQADESFIQATIADRIRRLMPRINQLNARQAALSANVEAKKTMVTEQLGLSRADLERAAEERKSVRQGIFDLLDTFGSAAFAGVDKAVVSELEKRAGLPLGSISARAKTMQETKEAGLEFKEVNGRIFTFDKRTGEVSDTGIAVPPEMSGFISSLLSTAGQFGSTPAETAAAFDFLRASIGVGAPSGVVVPTGKKVGALSDDELASVMSAMAQQEGFGKDPQNRPTRNNNPLNIKVPEKGIEEARRRYNDPGATVDPKPATDGGQFIVFSSPEKGFEAAETLLRSDLYSSLDLDAALRQWSNKTYGAEILKGQIGILPGGQVARKGAAPTISSKAPTDLSNLASRVSANPRLDDKDRTAFIGDFNRLIEAGNLPGALNAIKDNAVKSLPVAQQNEFKDYSVKTDRISGTLGNLDAFKATNPNLYKTILEKGKTLAAASKDQKWLALMSQIEALQVELRKEFFGTAVTNRETSTGANLFIDTRKDTLADMRTKLETLKKLGEDSAAGIVDFALGNF